MDYIYLLTVQFDLQNFILVLLFSSTPHFCCSFPHFLLVQCLLILGSWLPSSWFPGLDIGVVLPPTVDRSLLVRCHVVVWMLRMLLMRLMLLMMLSELSHSVTKRCRFVT